MATQLDLLRDTIDALTSAANALQGLEGIKTQLAIAEVEKHNLEGILKDTCDKNYDLGRKLRASNNHNAQLIDELRRAQEEIATLTKSRDDARHNHQQAHEGLMNATELIDGIKQLLNPRLAVQMVLPPPPPAIDMRDLPDWLK